MTTSAPQWPGQEGIHEPREEEQDPSGRQALVVPSQVRGLPGRATGAGSPLAQDRQPATYRRPPLRAVPDGTVRRLQPPSPSAGTPMALPGAPPQVPSVARPVAAPVAHPKLHRLVRPWLPLWHRQWLRRGGRRRGGRWGGTAGSWSCGTRTSGSCGWRGGGPEPTCRHQRR